MAKCLVLGADGFIGSHLVSALMTAGHETTAFCQYNSRGDRGWCPDYAHVVFGDVRDSGNVTEMISAYGGDVVFHLAALIGIPYSYTAPRSYVDTNITGTLNVLDSCTRLGVRCIITSTSEVYGSCQIAPMSETHPLNAQSPYAATKIAADQLALSFHRSFGTPVTILRPFNTYGPRQSARAVIIALITQVLDAEPGGEISVGNLNALRDWTYVTDTVAAFVACLDNFHAGEVINVGNGCAWHVGHVLSTICGILQKEVRVIQDPARVRPEAGEVDKLICDNTKAENALGWSPKVTMLEGLKKTIEWMKENRGKYGKGYAV